jgi:ribonuclease T1
VGLIESLAVDSVNPSDSLSYPSLRRIHAHEVQMNQSFPRRLVLALALIVLVLGSTGCARPTPAATRAAATPVSTASATPHTRPTATQTANIGGLAIATPQPGDRMSTVRAGQLPPEAHDTMRLIGLAIATPQPGDRMSTVRAGQLPPEAHDTMRLIARNGPFPYRQDGATFENRERLLPAKPSGYYREYTVKTPGSPDRGARRLVRGGLNELYYTDDHYDSFRRVIP